MRICFLGNGRSVHTKRWLEFFRDNGYEVYLITFMDVDIEGVTVYNVGSFDINPNGGNWKYICKLGRIKKILKEINPDIVNAHYITSYGFLGALDGFRPLVLSAWGTDILVTPGENFIYKMITKYTLNKADLITSDSEYMTKVITVFTSVRTITVPMGVEKRLLCAERNDNNNSLALLSLRTIDKNSNIDLVVKAFSILVKKYGLTDAKLTIVNDGPEMDNIKKVIDEERISQNVDIRGFVSRDELIGMLLSSSINISIPTSDSTSVSLLEGMACGIMNIVSDIPANTEWIQDGINGVIIRENSAEGIAKVIHDTYSNNEFRKNSIKVNKEIITQRALWDDNMKSIETEYKALVGKYR